PHPQPGYEGLQPFDQLKVLSDQIHRATDPDQPDEQHGQRYHEGPTAEQGHVQQGIDQAALPMQKHHARQSTYRGEPQRLWFRTVGGGVFDGIDDRQDRQQRQDHADQIRPARRRVGVLGQQGPRSDHDHGRDGYREQERRTPPERVHQPSADHGASGHSQGEHRRPYADGYGPLPDVGKHVRDQRQRRGHERSAGDAQQRPGEDQQLRARREGRPYGQGRERQRADDEQTTPPDTVPQRAHGDEEPGDEEPVDVHDPQDLGPRWRQIIHQVRHHQVQHRHIQPEQHGWQRQQP